MENYLYITTSILFFCATILSFYFMVTYLYSSVISLFGYKNLKKDYEIIDDETRFLILVAAHNEETVISQTLNNLKAINYDSSLFDICVVSDNSTDRTTEIARNHGVMVVDTIQQRFKRVGVGKPAGIQYALEELGFNDVKDKYNLVMVLDADNFVDPHILKEVNSQYIAKDKPEAIQTYLDTKNYNEWVSLAYSIIFWTNNRFSQAAKYRLGLPNSIGGTGFFIRTDWLINNGGFKFESLTEDLEMEIQIVKEGGRILWNDYTSIYDEKPESAKISMIQRHRWIKGHWYVAFKNVIPLTIKFITTLNIKYLDKIVFLMSMGKAFHIILMFILLMFLDVTSLFMEGLQYLSFTQNLTMTFEILNHYFFYIYGFNILLILYSFVILPVYSVFKRIGKHNFIKVTLAMQWYIYTDLLVQMLSLFTWHRQGVWVKTPHQKTELENDVEVLLIPDNNIQEKSV